jgi:hypothetical protein
MGYQVNSYLINSNAVQHMKGSMLNSFIDGGGLTLGFFLFYVTSFGVAWGWGYRKRDQMRKDAVEKAVLREKAIQALNAAQ